MAKRRKSKRKTKAEKKRIKKANLGKLVPFNLQNSPKKYDGFSNKYCYKTNIHRLIYKGAVFSNVKYQASIITNCNFRGAVFNGVDFCNCNLKGSNFQGARLNNVIFFNCNLSGCVFDKANFNNVNFIVTNIGVAKNICGGVGYKEIKTYPKIELSDRLKENIYNLAQFKDILIPRTIHVTKNKINLWMISLLLENTEQDDLARCFYALSNRKNKDRFYTIQSYQTFIDSYLQR